jgi:hypothetical protein
MTHNDFYNLVFDNWILYLVSLAFCALFFFYVGKKYTHTWFDPLRIQLVSSTFATNVFVFLFLKGVINTEIFSYLCLAEIFFWMAFMIGAKKNITFFEKQLTNEKSISFILYIIFLILFIIFMTLTYYLLGIPIFKGSRLDTYVGSGLGVLGRMMPFFKIYCIFYSFYLWNNSKKYSLERILVSFAFLIFIITGVLSGSRSSFFIFLIVYWGYCYFYEHDLTRITKYYKIFIIGIFVTLLTFSIQSGSKSFVGSFRPLEERVIASGDVYFEALPNDTWKHVQTGNWYEHLFYGLLRPARLLKDFQYVPVGVQLTRLIYPGNSAATYGPISIPAILGLVYFGWWGLIFSFVLGLFISMLIFHLPALMPKGIISSLTCLYVFLQVLVFVGDPCLGMGYLFDLILNLTLLIVLILAIQMLYAYASKKIANTKI